MTLSAISHYRGGTIDVVAPLAKTLKAAYLKHGIAYRLSRFETGRLRGASWRGGFISESRWARHSLPHGHGAGQATDVTKSPARGRAPVAKHLARPTPGGFGNLLERRRDFEKRLIVPFLRDAHFVVALSDEIGDERRRTGSSLWFHLRKALGRGTSVRPSRVESLALAWSFLP
jgi:hypothetical protein